MLTFRTFKFYVFFLSLLSFLFFEFATEANAAERRIVNQIGIAFVWINPGAFYMGSPENEAGRSRDEKRHRVILTKGFYMSITEITQDQWRRIMGYNPSAFPECGDRCPVENVSWYECREFIKKLNQYERTDTYTLPTEAQWEFACRAGSGKAFSAGDITVTSCRKDPVLDRIGWYCGNSGRQEPVHDLKPHPVGLKRPNRWGLYDMHGNVHEWVLDSCEWRYPSGYVGVVTDTYVDGIKDPYSGKGSRRIFRGGSWNQGAGSSRAANRSYYRPQAVRNNIGFRIIKLK